MTNEDLTKLYNDANGIPPGKAPPITTERIFAAMRAAVALGRQQCRDAIVETIPAGALSGRGLDATAQRNGQTLTLYVIDGLPTL